MVASWPQRIQTSIEVIIIAISTINRTDFFHLNDTDHVTLHVNTDLGGFALVEGLNLDSRITSCRRDPTQKTELFNHLIRSSKRTPTRLLELIIILVDPP